MAGGIIFGQNSVTMCGMEYQASYSVTPSGKVVVFAELDGEQITLQIMPDDEHHAEALAAAKPEAQNIEIAAEIARIDAEAQAERLARAEERAARKAEREAEREAAHKARAEAPISTASPMDKPWIGSSIKGRDWEIELGGGYDKIRVIFKKPPCADVKALVKEFGFYYSPTLKSWNRGVTCKGYRAAEKLAAHLRYYPAKPLSA